MRRRPRRRRFALRSSIATIPSSYAPNSVSLRVSSGSILSDIRPAGGGPAGFGAYCLTEFLPHRGPVSDRAIDVGTHCGPGTPCRRITSGVDLGANQDGTVRRAPASDQGDATQDQCPHDPFRRVRALRSPGRANFRTGSGALPRHQSRGRRRTLAGRTIALLRRRTHRLPASRSERGAPRDRVG